jgi:CTP:molybdopterin cytidylyltransferase MocA
MTAKRRPRRCTVAHVTLERTRLAAIVLAAGAGTRYSDEPGAKLLAPIGGRPVLEQVLATLRAYGPRTTIVVLGSGAEAVERSIAWVAEERVVNPAPQRGIASSIRTGILALRSSREQAAIAGVFIVLGDQPRLRADVLDRLASRAAGSARPIIVPAYADDPGPRNPVLLLRAAWPLIETLDGDHGLGPLISTRPDLVAEVGVAGAMPDLDEPADLERLERLAGPGGERA